MGKWYIARRQYSSLGEGEEVVSIGAVHMGDKVHVRVQVECGRDEVNDGEKYGERQNEEATKNRRSKAHREDGMTHAYRHLSQCSVMHINFEV